MHPTILVHSFEKQYPSLAEMDRVAASEMDLGTNKETFQKNCQQQKTFQMSHQWVRLDALHI